MRKGAFIFVAINLIIIGLLVRSVFTLLTLLFEDADADAIRRPDIPSPNSSLIDARPQRIPKIIHQTYKNETIPAMWKGAQQSCIDLHSDYEYKLWTDEKSMQFIAAEYPWFLDTFQKYRYPIQRADAIRYFVLAYYGGIYVDLDDGCNRRLDPLLTYPAWLRKTNPTGISNDAMGSVPQHPFFLRVIDSLQTYNRNWFLPYITVMYSTGPLFLSVIWKQYMESEPTDMGRVRIMMQDAYNQHSWSFFTHHPGSSWHGNDARLIFWMGGHWMLLTFTGFLMAGVVGSCLWCSYRRILGCASRFTRKGYKAIRSRSPPPIPDTPRTLSPSRRKIRIPFFHQKDTKKQDEETGTSETIYELINRHE